MLKRTTLLAMAAGLAAAAITRADDIDWNNPGGGAFNSASNWSPATIPGTSDRAIFDLSGTYTATFILSGRTNSRLRVGGDTVTLNLAGNDYTLTSATTTSVSVGGSSGHAAGGVGVLNVTSSGAGATFNSQSTQLGGDGSIFGSGTMTVGTNVTWNSAGLISVGSRSSGALTVQGGGDIAGFMGVIGDARTGAATVTGLGSTWVSSASLDVANQANGTLTVQSGGLLRNDETVVGAAAGAVGTISITGAPSRWENLGTLILGLGGSGVLNITGGGYASTVSLGGYDSLGENTGSSGTLTVSGPASEFRNTNGDLYVGRLGSGTLSVQAGGQCVPGRNVFIGGHPIGSGSVVVDGANSRFIPSNSVYVGGTSAAAAGAGSLTVNTGAQVTIGSGAGLTIWSPGTVNLAGGTIQLGTFLNSGGVFNWTSGTLRFLTRLNIKPTGPLGANVTVAAGKTLEGGGVEIDGAANPTLSVPGGTMNSGADFMVGNTASGALSLTNGAYAGCLSFTIGNGPSSVGSMTLDGAGTQCGVGQFGLLIDVLVGNQGTGTLEISGGASLFTAYNPFEIGEQAGSHGTVTVRGASSNLDTGAFYGIDIGRYGQGTLNVLDGARVDAPALMADQPGSSGAAVVSGAGSLWSAPALTVGNGGPATVTVQYGGALQVGDLYSTVFPGSSAQMLVTGVGSVLTATPGNGHYGQLIVGGSDAASLRIDQGGHATCDEMFVGDGFAGEGSVTVFDTGSNLTAAAELAVGYSGHGSLLVKLGATASTGHWSIGARDQAVGDATVDGAGSVVVAANSLDVGGGTFGRLLISNGGSVQVGGPASVAATGSISLMDGALTSTSLTLNGGLLSGTGTISANVVNAGTMYPGNSTGLVSIQGTYTQTGTLNVEIGGPTPGTNYDRLVVSGVAQFGGTLNITLVNGYTPRRGDVFTIITAGSTSGAFSAVDLPVVSGGSLRLVYSPTSVALVFCYPNCDGSTVGPILNVNDFSCFLNRFAAGDAYANCDGSTQPPVLNVNDFSCFLNGFAAGCP